MNTQAYTLEKVKVHIPTNLEIVWGLVKPRNMSAKFKKIIKCSFYSPPSKKRNAMMSDHITSTLHMLSAQYPDSGIIMGADRNNMDIKPILNCGLKLRQVVDKSTRSGQILDVLIMNTWAYYNAPIIAPPISPDDPSKGKPSDHWVPICTPHTDRYQPPQRNYRRVKYRPVPDSGIQKFGEWVVTADWDKVVNGQSSSELVSNFERLVQTKLDDFCPVKEMKISSQDKPFITADMKKLHRQRSREYIRHGKSEKYEELAQKFKILYKKEAKKYLDKNVLDLKIANPGKAYGILKRLGAQPGDCEDLNGVTLQSHVDGHLTEEQSAEKIADHFAAISQEFIPFDVKNLPDYVQDRIKEEGEPPEITEFETYQKIKGAKKPKSGVPNDLPRKITQEFSPELAEPIRKIISNIARTGEWPRQWKLEYITPIGKIPNPETEDDLRPISLTSFFSKVTENSVVHWIMDYIKDKVDFRQYGGFKGNSITHYLIEFINFILSQQDKHDQTAVLACMVDFSKAFNRQNHHILITKLCNLGLPGWLLRIVIGFLTERKMIVRYKGKQSQVKSLPGGGPQGTLLGLLLFIILINDLGFEGQVNNTGEIITCRRNLKKVNEIHLKYVDDLTMAESINLKTQ